MKYGNGLTWSIGTEALLTDLWIGEHGSKNPYEMKNGVIVLGGHIQGLGIIRIFGENGIPVILIDETKVNLGKHSKFCRKFFRIGHNADILDFLMNKLPVAAEVKDWLLIPTNDKYVNILSRNKNKLETYYKVSVDKWDSVRYCYDKRLTYKLAEKVGVDIPRTIFFEETGNIDELQIDFPCIIKPAIMHKFYSKVKSKVFVCYSKEDLKEKITVASKIIPSDEIIIQEIIPGDSYNQYSACYFYDTDKPVVVLEARRKRQHPPDFGSATTFAETVDIPEIGRISDIILREIGFWGICEVEFKFDNRDNKYKLLEINPRTWKWHTISKISDSPFLMSLYNCVYFNEPIRALKWKPARWQHFTTDFIVLARKMFRSTGTGENHPEKQHAVYDRHDIYPSLFELIYLAYYIFKR